MADKVKFSITSDGTSEGTKIVLNGENIVETKQIVSTSFYASAATAYPDCHCMGECCCGGSMKQYPESINFDYTALEKNDKGEKIYTRYNFTLSESKWEPIITPLGKPVPAEASEEDYSDSINVLGKDSKLVTDILDLSKKTKRYIPTRKELIGRSTDSLKDMLEDMKKEL